MPLIIVAERVYQYAKLILNPKGGTFHLDGHAAEEADDLRNGGALDFFKAGNLLSPRSMYRTAFPLQVLMTPTYLLRVSDKYSEYAVQEYKVG